MSDSKNETLTEKINETFVPFGWKDKIGYGLGDFGCNMSFSFISNYLLLFYVTCMGISTSHYAIIIFLAKCFDAINDPIIGNLVDTKKAGKDGRFKTWIKWASIPLFITSIILFIYMPDMPYYFKCAYCLIVYCLWSICYTSVNVPYGSMQSVITNVPDQRSSLSLYRSIFSGVAQVLVSVIIPLVIYDSNNNPEGKNFIILVGVMGVIGYFCFYGCRKLTTERLAPPVVENKQKMNLWPALVSYFKNRHMMGYTIATFAYLAGMMTVTTTMQYLFMVYYQNTDLISIATVIVMCPMVIGILLMKPLTKKFTKRQLCTYPFILTIVAAGILSFVEISSPYIWMLVMGIAMLGSSFFLVLGWALVADCIDFQAAKDNDGSHKEGTFYAIYSFFRKLAQGVGASMISALLGVAGYDSALDAASQASGVAENIYLLAGIIPFIAAIIAFISMLVLYRLSDNPLEGFDNETAKEKELLEEEIESAEE